MKKLLTILSLSAFTVSSIFAVVVMPEPASSKSAQVQLVNTIEETPVSYKLYYNEVFLEDGIEEYAISVAPLTEDGETENFTVHATSNMNRDMAVEVSIAPETFKTTLNDGSVGYDSTILPQVKTMNSLDVLEAGKHTNLLVNKFHLKWDGNSNLPAGDYVSNVKIEYSIQ